MPSSIKPSVITIVAGLALSACLLTTTLRADTQPTVTTKSDSTASPVAIGAGVGTAGYGPFVVLTASKNLTATLGYTFFNYDRDVSTDDGDFKGKIKLSNVQAILNWHPFSGTFHLSAGAFLGNNKVTVTGKPKANATYEIGDATYTAAQVGTLNGEVEIAKGAVPYVGLGWSKKALKSGFGCFFDLGVMLQSSPKAKLSATGPISSDATFKSNVVKEESKVNDEMKPFRYYPLIQFGLMYRF